MADAAILAHHVLVLEHDAGPRAIVLRDVGAADQVDDLVRLDGAGARIHRIGTDAGEIVDLERDDRAVALDPDPALAAMVAGVNVGVEAFDPVGDKLDRPAQQFRQRVGRHFVGIGGPLMPKEPPTSLQTTRTCDSSSRRCRAGPDVLHHMRRLGALVDRQAGPRRLPVGDHRARLQRHAGMPPKTNSASTTSSESANASSTLPASRLRSKARLSPSEG